MKDFSASIDLPNVEHLTNFLKDMTILLTILLTKVTFCVFYSTNIVKSDTCLTKIHISLIDLILTNNCHILSKRLAIGTGYRKYYKVITTIFKLHFSKLRPKLIT